MVIDGTPEGVDPAQIIEIIRAADHRGPVMGLGWTKHVRDAGFTRVASLDEPSAKAILRLLLSHFE